MFENYDITVSNKIGPQYTWFSRKELLYDFCSFIMSYYQNTEKLNYLHRLFEDRKAENRKDGISDMTLLGLFIKENSLKVFDFANLRTPEYFDNNINSNDGFETTSNIKKIVFENGNRFVIDKQSKEKVKLNALHFQSTSKYLMHRYYSASFPAFKVDYLKRELIYLFKFKIGSKLRVKAKLKSLIQKLNL